MNKETRINFEWIAKKLILEITETAGGALLFGLKWGESKIGTDIFGISRAIQIGGLNWADKNPKEAMQILNKLKK